MKSPLHFKGKIVEENGKKRLQITTETLYKRIIDSLKLGEVLLTIEPKKNTRSINQHRYYFLYLDVVSEETGDDPNSLHEFFKRKFLPPRFVKVMGQEIKLPATTTELSKSEMVEYIMRIEALTGVPAPNPEEVGFISNNDFRLIRYMEKDERSETEVLLEAGATLATEEDLLTGTDTKISPDVSQGSNNDFRL